MGLFDDIVPPDTASGGGYSPLRITVRPKGVEPPPASPHLDDMPADVGRTPNQVEPWGTGGGASGKVAPSPRTAGLFDDIVAPAAAAPPSAETLPSSGPAPGVAREGLSPPAPEPSLLSRLASPVTDIPHEIYQAGADSLGAANTYLNPWSEGYRKGVEADRDKWVSTGPGSFLGTGKGLLAAIGVPFSPITGAMRSLIGHPFSVIMPTATPQEQERMRKAGVSESMIPGQTREENYQKTKRDVDFAMMALTPRGFTPRGAIPRVGPPPPARPPDTAAAQSDRMMSEARESGPFDSNARPAEATTPGSPVAAENGGATFGSANSNRYRVTFFGANPELRGHVVVHHAVEQRVLKMYPGVVTDAEMHSLENLRGIPRPQNSELHLRQIRREWDQFYEEHPTATRQQLLQKAAEIDAKYGSQFKPPIKPGR